MKELLYGIVELIAKIHEHLLRLNDSYEYNFTDKELHFLVIGIIGMGIIFVVYPFFKWLAKKDHVMVIAWIYVFTLILVITFAIEIGQKVTNTGNMEFADIVLGIFGFIVMFFIFAVIREVYKAIKRGIKRLQRGKNQRRSVRHNDYEDEEAYENSCDAYEGSEEDGLEFEDEEYGLCDDSKEYR